jgi:hypothetical protein
MSERRVPAPGDLLGLAGLLLALVGLLLTVARLLWVAWDMWAWWAGPVYVLAGGVAFASAVGARLALQRLPEEEGVVAEDTPEAEEERHEAGQEAPGRGRERGGVSAEEAGTTESTGE